VFSAFWHGIDQNIIDNAIDEWHGRLRTCVRAKGGHCEQLLWQYSAMRQETFQFFKCDNFSIVFWKLPQIQTSNFRKVVWQHTEELTKLSPW